MKMEKNKSEKEKFFWADKIAEEIIKNRKEKEVYICASGIGVSGTLHIGNFRDAITTDLVVRALKNKGKKARFIYSLDNFDRFRKVPANIPEKRRKEFENYIGMPVSEIPNPFGKGKYTEYFENIFIEELKKVNVKPKFISQSFMYKKCKYAKLIKTALEKRKEIMEVLNMYRKEPLGNEWYPLSVYCEKCKKDFTKILSIKNYEIEYECTCGHKSKFDFRKKGIVKLKWRVDWPMRWFYEKVDFEPGGADIGAAGGSMMTSDKIVKEIFHYEPPFHTYYEFVSPKGVGGKISSSKGNALTISDVLEIYEPEIVRYLFVGTRPNKGFEISFDNDVIKIYEDFDELERKYYSKEINPQEKRIYELSMIKVRKKKPERVSFRHLITLVQTGKTNKLCKDTKKRIKNVRNWLDKYASDDFKFEIQEKINEDVSLSDKQKMALRELRKILEIRNFKEEELLNEFYNICNAVGIKGDEFFKAAYNVILNKNRGPRLATLILTVGKEKIIKLLRQI